jgi:hypothetical protein
MSALLDQNEQSAFMPVCCQSPVKLIVYSTDFAMFGPSPGRRLPLEFSLTVGVYFSAFPGNSAFNKFGHHRHAVIE